MEAEVRRARAIGQCLRLWIDSPTKTHREVSLEKDVHTEVCSLIMGIPRLCDNAKLVTRNEFTRFESRASRVMATSRNSTADLRAERELHRQKTCNGNINQLYFH